MKEQSGVSLRLLPCILLASWAVGVLCPVNAANSSREGEHPFMNRLRICALAAAAVLLAATGAPKAAAQISVGVNIGTAPVCPYGYFDYAPYNCAPYGYYGPEWFTNGVFIGAGPWYHGHENFHGHVDNHFDPHHGYHGHIPARNEHADPHNRVDHMEHFHGNEMRDGHGH
jgi:hypothetical protein